LVATAFFDCVTDLIGVDASGAMIFFRTGIV
jgi:hypothetical protein